jgi:hypothetical protein
MNLIFNIMLAGDLSNIFETGAINLFATIIRHVLEVWLKSVAARHVNV